MKAICEREKLSHAFQTAAGVAPSRSPKPILQNLKLELAGEKAVLTGTDLEVGIRMEVPGFSIEQPGSVILPKERFGRILQESSDEKLSLEGDEKQILVRGERSEFQLPLENPEEFPDIAAFEADKYHEVPVSFFRETIRRTIFATDNESSRYALGGVLIEFADGNLTAVATDGRRLAKQEGPVKSVGEPLPSDQMTIVPTRAMQLIERALGDGEENIMLAARENDLLVRSGTTTIYTRLKEGRFPKWREVFPRREVVAKIDLTVGPFHAAVRQAAIVTSEERRGVDFTFGEGKVVLAARGAELGQSHVELPIAYESPSVSVMLDPRYINDFLRVLDPERVVTMEIRDAETAVVFATDDGYAYVVMPLARDQR
ncbi:MAG: DNA polymerase III subunit beta [Pirellulales bacterium]|nr:DNA polymerase III subunit beta [Pirellulales bacterium]